MTLRSAKPYYSAIVLMFVFVCFFQKIKCQTLFLQMNNKENGIVSSIQFHFHNICEHIVLFVFQRLNIHFIKKTSE